MRFAIFLLLRICVLFLLWKAYLSHFFLPESGSQVVVALDVSKSIPEDSRNALIQKFEHISGSESQKRIGFAQKTLIGEPSSTLREFSSLLKEKEKSKTDLESALRTSLDFDPAAVFLLSDGNENNGSAMNLLRQLEFKKIPIYPLAPEKNLERKEIKISDLFVPFVAKLGKAAEIRTTLINPTKTRQNAHVTIKHGESILLDREIQLLENQEMVLTAEGDSKLQGRNPVQVVLRFQDETGTHVESKIAYISSEKPDSVLILSGTPEDDRFLTTLFKEKSYKVESALANPGVTLNPGEYQVIVLNNVPKEKLPADFQSQLRKFVEAGKGLVVTGGDKSFGLGGYLGSELAEILPVELVPPQAEKKRLDLAVMLVIDKSESMRHDARMEFAKEAAKQVILNLKPNDYVGVIGFDLTPFVVVSIGRLSNVRDYALRQIQDLFPTRVTRLYPALTEAAAQLQGVKAGRKHMIILTDGKLPDEEELEKQYESLVREMRFTGITLSTVLIGEPNLGYFLRHLANLGGGAHYQTQDPSSLPRIFLNDMQVVGGEKTLKESSLYEVIAGPQGVSSTSLTEFPPLRGYVETKPRAGARLELSARGNMAADPLLASWNYKSGRVIAFTSDANGRWSSDWVPWARFRQFWTEIIETARGVEGNKAKPPEFDVKPVFLDGKTKLDLVVYGELKEVPKVTITNPDSTTAEYPFFEVEPGHYQTSQWDNAIGMYKADISSGDIRFPQIAWEVDSQMIEESSARGNNFALLEKIAAASGGKVNPKKEEIKIRESAQEKNGEVDMRFVVYALLAFIGELIVRVWLRKLFPRISQ